MCRRRLLAKHKEGFSLPFDTYRMHVSDHEIPQSQIPSQLHGHFLSGPLSDSNCSCRVFVLLITGNDSYRDRRCVAKDPWNYANIHRLPVLLAYKCRLHYFNRWLRGCIIRIWIMHRFFVWSAFFLIAATVLSPTAVTLALSRLIFCTHYPCFWSCFGAFPMAAAQKLSRSPFGGHFGSNFGSDLNKINPLSRN